MEALKQPQLGKTIQALRLEKKLTQEELVDKCNVNVRTLQRIEAGDVSPREYTIKAIFEALDSQLEQVATSIGRKSSIQKMNIGWVAGVVFFVFGFGEAIIDYVRFEDDLPIYFPFIYTSIKVIVLVAYALFMLGFAEAGKTLKSSILRISAYLMMGSMIVIELYDIISIFSGLTLDEFIKIRGFESVALGGVDIVFGIALIKIGKQLGMTSFAAGFFEVIIGICFVTFFLAFLGLIFMIPAVLLEVIVLYKCYELVQGKA
ncbi:MAG: helix-turn-helix domain-containing protein [Ekhidna sp.]